MLSERSFLPMSVFSPVSNTFTLFGLLSHLVMSMPAIAPPAIAAILHSRGLLMRPSTSARLLASGRVRTCLIITRSFRSSRAAFEIKEVTGGPDKRTLRHSMMNKDGRTRRVTLALVRRSVLDSPLFSSPNSYTYLNRHIILPEGTHVLPKPSWI
jgi:hypothetical protein